MSKFYISCTAAAKDLNPANPRAQYMEIYNELRAGNIQGAYIDAHRWIIPVAGLRAAGFRVSGKGAVHVVPREEVPPADDVEVYEDDLDIGLAEVPDLLGALAGQFADLKAENEYLRVSLEAAIKRAETAEDHYQDLRTILDFATEAK